MAALFGVAHELLDRDDPQLFGKDILVEFFAEGGCKLRHSREHFA